MATSTRCIHCGVEFEKRDRDTGDSLNGQPVMVCPDCVDGGGDDD